ADESESSSETMSDVDEDENDESEQIVETDVVVATTSTATDTQNIINTAPTPASDTHPSEPESPTDNNPPVYSPTPLTPPQDNTIPMAMEPQQLQQLLNTLTQGLKGIQLQAPAVQFPTQEQNVMIYD